VWGNNKRYDKVINTKGFMGVLSRVDKTIVIYGDIHLSSRNYGSHNDYASESLHNFNIITEVAKEVCATHIIGLGDMSYGRFHTLEYRKEVEKILIEQYDLVNGERYEIRGNHDIASYGMTEYEYYIHKGLMKPATELRFGNIRIHMSDYNNQFNEDVVKEVIDGDINILLAHNFFKFKDSLVGEYGKSIVLDDKKQLFGIDYIVSGHVHDRGIYSGSIIKDGTSHKTVVYYPGCLNRPAYRVGNMDDEGDIVVVHIKDGGTLDLKIHRIKLWDLAKSFNLSLIKTSVEKKAAKIDLSDVVARLNEHEREVGSVEGMIESMDVKSKYKEKALKLLKEGMK